MEGVGDQPAVGGIGGQSDGGRGVGSQLFVAV